MSPGVVGTPHLRSLQLRCHQGLRPRLQQDDGRVSLQGGSRSHPHLCPVSPGCGDTPESCHCPQENHYRPAGSDSCLLCDCYATGSLSRLCDVTSGQCPCKAGVIGRHCDRCDNPFAEVTASGCEGGCCCPPVSPAATLLSACCPLAVTLGANHGCHCCPCVTVLSPRRDALLFPAVNYDSCPRAIEASIWWPRTRFGLPAAAPCPKGSVGRWGTRGWRSAVTPVSPLCRAGR